MKRGCHSAKDQQVGYAFFPLEQMCDDAVHGKKVNAEDEGIPQIEDPCSLKDGNRQGHEETEHRHDIVGGIEPIQFEITKACVCHPEEKVLVLIRSEERGLRIGEREDDY